MKILFNVRDLVPEKLPRLLKELYSINCLMQVDFKESTVMAIISSPNVIDAVVDLVNSSFAIDKIDIDCNSNLENNNSVSTDNTESSFEQGDESPENSDSNQSDDFSDDANDVDNTIKHEVDDESPDNITTEITVDKPAPAHEISEDDIRFEPIVCRNPVIEDALNRLAKTAHWLIKVKGVDADTILQYMISVKNELRLQFDDNNIQTIDFAVGDIVNACIGMHITGETSGGIYAIVANISDCDSMPYLVPLYCSEESVSNHNYMELESGKDYEYNREATYSNPKEYALLDMGQYVNPIRVRNVVGKCSDSFLSELIECIPEAFCFNDASTALSNTDETTTADVNGKSCDSECDTVTDDTISTALTSSQAKTITEKLRAYIMKKESGVFTRRELTNQFPNILPNTISFFLNSEKKHGTICSTGKRGQYEVIKK